jgi:hypothetical protein
MCQRDRGTARHAIGTEDMTPATVVRLELGHVWVGHRFSFQECFLESYCPESFLSSRLLVSYTPADA